MLSQTVLDQLGPAVNAGHSLFVYGPPGNGKSVISQAIGKLLDGDIAVPHALEVEGQIIRFYDPVNHHALPLEDQEGLDAGAGLDRRWVRCRRPIVLVGGELGMSSLELWFNEPAGFYHAPVQAIANGGVLVIDDFGRQQCEPRQFLNRWIVPLESRVDYLTLHTGQKFELPFDVLLVFATNLKPSSLVDEAFLRRIRYKVFAESPTVRGLPDDLRALLLRARPRLRFAARGLPAARVPQASARPAARLPSARPHRPRAVAGRVPRRAAWPHRGAARGGVRRLLRGRPRARSGVCVTGPACLCLHADGRRDGGRAAHRPRDWPS